MTLKKMRTKTHKGTKKRIKVTNGGNGKLMIARINQGHRMIKKSRTRKLRARRKTVLSKTYDKLKKVM